MYAIVSTHLKTSLALLAGLLSAAAARAELVELAIGIDGRQTLSSGPFAGKPNPNAGRLTFLYAHGYSYVPGAQPAGESSFANNHYHAISSYSLTGPTNNPTVLNTNANSRIPEVSTKQPPLTLVPGTGLYTGKLVNDKTAEHYSTPRWLSVWKFNDPSRYGPGSPEYIMFHSSGGTRTNSLAGSRVALELVEKSPELNIGSTNELHILRNSNDRFDLGDGNEIDFRPVFWVEPNTPVGHYSAAFKLVDTNVDGARTPHLESGIFYLDFQVAPEPSILIESVVNVSLPLVAPGYLLEGAESLTGHWSVVPLAGAKKAMDTQTLTLPGTGEMKVFRLRKP